MRKLGMNKRTAGNAHALANSNVPDYIVIDDNSGKTVGQQRNERKRKRKEKNKQAKNARRRNRR